MTRDAVALVKEQDANRAPWLVPLRHQRMGESPFAFYRGAARVMATDLARQPTSGLTVQACGDAHLANFGAYASAERRLVFDVNDFDETLPGPWEWDVKRLSASGVIAAQHNGVSADKQRDIALAAVQGYAQAMKSFAIGGYRDVWNATLDIEGLLSQAADNKQKSRVSKASKKAQKRDVLQAFRKLTEPDGAGGVQIKHDPPLLVPFRYLAEHIDPQESQQRVNTLFDSYLSTLRPDVRRLVERYRPVDAAMKVVGVGSVGTFCFVGLLMGRDDYDPFLLQVKQATNSVLEEHLAPSEYQDHGERVVQGQRMTQSSSDPFLGWSGGFEGRSFYWRQLRDWKWSPEIDAMGPKKLSNFLRLCGWTLAHGHARSGDAQAISDLLESSTETSDEIVDFSLDYSIQNLEDYRAFVESTS